jgi:hypothetical protein
MKTIFIIAITIALGFAIYALASGPGIIEIIDNPRL